jgi:hypothetical protein
VGYHTSGDVNVHNSNFVGYNGACVSAAGSANISGCEVQGHVGGDPFILGSNSIFTGNKVYGSYGYSAITLADRSICKGNYFYPSVTNNHADIKANGTGNIVEGNYIIHQNTSAVADNYAIYSYAGTGTNFITGNYLYGSSRATVAHAASDIVLNNFQNGAFLRADINLWTPTDGSGALLTLAPVSASCTYDKVGRQITLSFDITYPVTANASGAVLSGLPFPADVGAFGGVVSFTTYSGGQIIISAQSSLLAFFNTAGSLIANSALSGKRIAGSITYFTTYGG